MSASENQFRPRDSFATERTNLNRAAVMHDREDGQHGPAGKIDVLHSLAGNINDVSNCKVNSFEIRPQRGEFELGKGVEDLISERTSHNKKHLFNRPKVE